MTLSFTFKLIDDLMQRFQREEKENKVDMESTIKSNK